MDAKNKLEEINKEALEKLEDYINQQGQKDEENQGKVTRAKDEWQHAWNKLMETLLVLEKLEI